MGGWGLDQVISPGTFLLLTISLSTFQYMQNRASEHIQIFPLLIEKGPRVLDQ